MLTIPQKPEAVLEFAKELADECTQTTEDRQGVYEKATQYYWTGSGDVRAAIHNKVRTFINRLSGYLYQPNKVRFNAIFESTQPQDVLERARVFSEILTADYRSSDGDVRFADAVTWALNCGCYFLKHLTSDDNTSFRVVPVHPANMGVLNETITSLDEQEAFCHTSYYTITRLHAELVRAKHPDTNAIMRRVTDELNGLKDQNEPGMFHPIVIGGLNPLGEANSQPEAAGITQVFPVPTPWRPQKKLIETVRHCELWIKDRDRDGDYTVLQLIYPNVLLYGRNERQNLFIPDSGHHPFVKVESNRTPGYFWGRSSIADVQMLQDVINKRLRDLKVMWDRNAAAPYAFSGFTSITEDQYYKLISEGGFINDPNPQAKASKLTEPPPPEYMEELEFVWQMFDEAGGFSPIMTGQGESGVRAGVHAQTLVRTSSPGLIDPATRIERCLAESGYLCARLLAHNDANLYAAESGTKFRLATMNDYRYQIEVDSHSASPAFAEDSRQIALMLAQAQAIDAEGLIRMLHPPGEELLIAELKQRQAAQARAQQEAAAMGQNVQPMQQHRGGHHR